MSLCERENIIIPNRIDKLSAAAADKNIDVNSTCLR